MDMEVGVTLSLLMLPATVLGLFCISFQARKKAPIHRNLSINLYCVILVLILGLWHPLRTLVMIPEIADTYWETQYAMSLEYSSARPFLFGLSILFSVYFAGGMFLIALQTFKKAFKPAKLLFVLCLIPFIMILLLMAYGIRFPFWLFALPFRIYGPVDLLSVVLLYELSGSEMRQPKRFGVLLLLAMLSIGLLTALDTGALLRDILKSSTPFPLGEALPRLLTSWLPLLLATWYGIHYRKLLSAFKRQKQIKSGTFHDMGKEEK